MLSESPTSIISTPALSSSGKRWHSCYSEGHEGECRQAYCFRNRSRAGSSSSGNQELINKVKEEHKQRVGDYQYKGFVPEGPPPLDYK